MSDPQSDPPPTAEAPARSQHFLTKLDERRATLLRTLTPIIAVAKELVVEFGSGHGHFLVAYAQAHPTEACVGVDIDPNRVERANRKQVRAKAARLHFLQADAGLFLEVLPANVTFKEVFILFPDPWPKKRHHKHRLIQPAFLDKISSRATENTRIFFRTDHTPYFENARATFEQHPNWRLVDEPWAFEHETVFQSRAASFHSLVARPRETTP